MAHVKEVSAGNKGKSLKDDINIQKYIKNSTKLDLNARKIMFVGRFCQK